MYHNNGTKTGEAKKKSLFEQYSDEEDNKCSGKKSTADSDDKEEDLLTCTYCAFHADLLCMHVKLMLYARANRLLLGQPRSSGRERKKVLSGI